MHKGMQVHGALNNKCRWTLPLRSVSDQRQGGRWNFQFFPTNFQQRTLRFSVVYAYYKFCTLFIFKMPQPDGEVQVPRPVVPDPAPGNDAPEPPAGQRLNSSIDSGRRKTWGKRLSRVYSSYSQGFYSVFSFSFFFLWGGGGCFLFMCLFWYFLVPVWFALYLLSCTWLGYVNVIMYRRLSLGASGVCLLVLCSMSFGVPCCYFPRSWVFGLYIRIILYCLQLACYCK